MRSFTRIILAAALAVLSPGLAPAAITALNVTARNPQGGLMADVTVAAVNFGANGPSTHTVIGKTLTDGTTTLDLTTGMHYELFYSSHGFSPAIQDQFNNPDPSVRDRRHFNPLDATPLSSTVTFTSALAEVGRIALDFINATPGKVLFGGVNINALQLPGSQGIVAVNGAGGGTLAVDNVPFAAANTYNIGLYDPEKNKGVGRSVELALNGGNTFIYYFGGNQVDFDQSIAPTRVENTAAQNSDGGSYLSVEGVVRSTEPNWVPIPRTGVGFGSCVGDARAEVDENGRFQLYNLVSGTTYYAHAFGGCTWTQAGPGDCFEPSRSPALAGGQTLCAGPALAGNDFVYVSSSSLQYQQIKLNRAPKGIGTIKAYVKSASGFAIPNADIHIRPDYSAWNTNNCPGTGKVNISTPGFTVASVNVSATGYALLDGLSSGNYEISVWTPFSQKSGNHSIGAGPNGVFSSDWQQGHCDQSDDFRITVDTAVAPNLKVFNYLGAPIAISSITVLINTGSDTSGLVKGTLAFSSVVDLSSNPVMITLNPNCQSNCSVQGNFAMINGSGAGSYDYNIPVSSGASYWMDVRVKNWGRVRNGGDDDSSMVSLLSTGTAVINMSFMPAGTITGTLYKPGGTVYTPGNNDWVWVHAGSNSGGADDQLDKDGIFILDGVLPGVNSIEVNSSTMSYALPSPNPTVTVTAGVTSSINLNLVNANYVGIGLDITKTPNQRIVIAGGGSDAAIGFRVITLPSGSIFNGKTITKILNEEGGEKKFGYSGITDAVTDGPCGRGWNPAGFCADRLPSPAVYDFYLARAGGDEAAIPDAPYVHFTIISSSKGVVVDNARAIASVRPRYSVNTASGVLVDLTPATNMSSRGNATLYAQVTASNFFRQADFDGTDGNFNKFVEFLPAVALYDANGAFAAAGMGASSGLSPGAAPVSTAPGETRSGLSSRAGRRTGPPCSGRAGCRSARTCRASGSA